MNIQQYLLVCFMEECMEVAHAASKVLRFTKDDTPALGGISNYQNLNKEFSELIAVVEMLKEHNIELIIDSNLITKKRKRLADYAHYSSLLGVIKDDTNH